MRLIDTFFNEWTRDSAYVIGLILSDGCLESSSNRVVISTIYSSLADNLKQLIPNSIINPPSGLNGAYQVRFCSKQARHKLEGLGFQPRKTFYEPKLLPPKSVLGDFIRGYFDGDGSVSYCNVRKLYSCFCSGSKELLEHILGLLRSNTPIVGGCLTYNKNAGAWYLKFSHHDTRRLGYLMYSIEPFICLEYKKNIINPFL